MPQTIPTSSELYREWERRLPSWAFRGLTRIAKNIGAGLFNDVVMNEHVFNSDFLRDEESNKDPIYGATADRFEDFYKWLEILLKETRITDADAIWLDLHAWDRGLYRRSQESDDSLRMRIRSFPEVATERAIHQAVLDVLKPGLPSGYSRAYHSRYFYARTRLAPDLAIDTFTLRYRFLAWTDGVMTNNRLRAWGKLARWGRYTFPDRPSLPRRSWCWRIGFWSAGTWTNNNDMRGEREMLNPYAVAVVLVPPQLLYVRSFWRQPQWSRNFWGGAQPNLPRYRAIREAVEQVRAAGVEVQIWIKGDG